jgi:hypothetical protein
MAIDETQDQPIAAEPQEGQTAPAQTGPIQINSALGIDAEQKVIDDMAALFEPWESWRRPYETLWEEIYRLYFSSQDKRKTTTRSTITVPIVFQVIEAAVPKIVNSIFGSGEEFFDIIPVNPADQHFAEGMKTLLTFQLNQAEFMVKFVDFVKQLLLYGTSYFHVYWKVRREWVTTRVPNRQPLTVNGIVIDENHIEWQETREYKVTERRPEIEVLDILDVFPDPESRNENDARGVFVRSWMSLEDVKNMGKGQYPIFGNTDHPKLLAGNTTYSESRQARYGVRGLSTPPAKDLVEVLTFWGKYDLDGDGIKEKCQIILANREVILVARANPFHHQQCPVVRCVFFPIPLEWFGMGLVEPIISNVHELWTLRRQRIDNINLILNRMWKVNSLADVDLDTLISTPNGIILTDNMEGVMPLETSDVTSSAYNEATIVQSDIENATAPRSIQGAPESGRLGRTAKGAQLIIGQALEKFAVGTKLVEELGIKRVLKLVQGLNLQFIDSDEQLNETYGFLFQPIPSGEIDPLTGQPVMIPPAIQNVEDLRVDFRYKMVGISDMIGTEGKIQQLTTIFGTFAPYLAPESIESILDKIVKLSGFDPNEINIMAVANPLGAMAASGGERPNPEQNAILEQNKQNGPSSPKAPGRK